MNVIKSLAFGVVVFTTSLVAADAIIKRVDVVMAPNKKRFVISMNPSD